MGDPILSQDEINALMRASSNLSLNEQLLAILSPTAENVVHKIRVLIPYAVEMEGPYVETLLRPLDTVFGEEVYIVPADVGSSELFWMVSARDAAVLANSMASNISWALQTIFEPWMADLADAISDRVGRYIKYVLYTPKPVKPEVLRTLPIEENTLLARHVLHWADEGIEIAFLVQGSQVPELMEQRDPRRKSKTEPQSTNKQGPDSGRRFLKGQKSPVTKAVFESLDVKQHQEEHLPLALVEDVDLQVTVELGRTIMTLEELMTLKPKTTIPLQRLAGDPVDVYINGNPIAKAEVVVLDENFGIRILEIVPSSERIRND